MLGRGRVSIGGKGFIENQGTHQRETEEKQLGTIEKNNEKTNEGTMNNN